MRTRWPVLTLLLVGLTPALAYADDCDDWRQVAPLPGQINILAMESSGSVVVGVGDAGKAIVSTNGTDWAMQDTGSVDSMNALAWTGSTFVGAGKDGGVITSPDGVTWTARDSGATQDFWSLAWSGSLLLAQGNGGGVYTSPDGITWTDRGAGPSGSRGISYANGLFVALGTSASVYTSPDGIAWTDQSGTHNDSLYDIAYGAGLWVAVGPGNRVYTSADMSAWTRVNFAGGGTVWDIDFIDNQFILAGDFANVATSPDGTTWTVQDPLTGTDLRSVLKHGDDLLVSGMASVIQGSTDGATWAPRTTAVASGRLSDGLRVGGLTTVVGVGTAYSADGVTWAPSPGAISGNFAAVAHDGTTWLTGSNLNWVVHSTDALNWSQTNTGNLTTIRDLHGFSGQFAAATNDGLFTSTALDTWTKHFDGAIYGVVHSAGLWVAIGADPNGPTDLVYTSTDGTTWTTTTAPDWSFRTALTYGGGLFATTGYSGEIWTSPDGLTWSERNAGVTDHLGDIAHDGKRFVATPDGGDYVLTSLDGAAWRTTSLPGVSSSGAAGWDGGSLVLGPSGLILTSSFRAVCAAPQDVSVAEGGATLDVDFKLNQAPTHDVTVTLTPDAQLQLSASSLTFTTSNWDVTQTVSVTAVDDAADEGPHTGVITVTTGSTDGDYDTLSTSDITLDIIDNDVAGVVIEESASSTDVTEGGSTDTYTLALTRAPAASVQVDFGSDGQAQAQVASVTFDTANWNVPQTITVEAIDDVIDEENHTGTVTHTTSSTDTDFDGLTVPDITVQIVDNDDARFVIVESDGSTVVGEDGTTDTVTVALATQPIADVQVRVRNVCVNSPVRFPTALTVDLDFTAANWNTPQTVTLTANDDSAVEGGEVCPVAVRGGTTTDPSYASVAEERFDVSIDDNDTTAALFVDVPPDTIGGLDEALPSQRITVFAWLGTIPTADVTLTLTYDAQVFADFRPEDATAITLTPLDFATRKQMVFSVVDDLISEGPHSGEVVLTATSTDSAYDGLTVTWTLDVLDDDTGVIFTGSPTVQLAEGGITASYELQLTDAPTGPVDIALAPDAQITVSPASVQFTDGNFGVTQTITLTAVDDTVVESTHTGTLTHSVTSTDTLFDGFALPDITATIADNDTAPVDTGDTADTADTGSGDTGTPGDDGGCGCATGPTPTMPALLGLLAVALVRRRTHHE